MPSFYNHVFASILSYINCIIKYDNILIKVFQNTIENIPSGVYYYKQNILKFPFSIIFHVFKTF